MLRAIPVFALMIIGLAFSASVQVGAQEVPRNDTERFDKIAPAFVCSAQTEGQLTCQANKQCQCVYKRGDAASGLPDRWAWDCGIMRPRCEVTPADTGDRVYPLPPVIIERNDHKDHEGDGGEHK